MCGIVGIAHLDGEPCEASLLRQMCQAIRHRGPDGQGVKVFQGGQHSVGLGHQRLSIVDLAGGAQPMSLADESLWIVFNGEIYNHQELRKELESLGHQYHSRSDTESILHAYQEWGEGCLDRLQGMFAFAIWDPRRRFLFVARDRLGIKPLYYAETPRGLVFASEIKAILASKLIAPALATEMLPEQMTFGYIAGPQTLFKGISKLPPGYSLTWQDGKCQVKQFWDVPSASPTQSRSNEETIEQFGSLFEETVRSHLMSDVPLGVFLSGGLDSDAIAATMARNMTEPLKTFSIGFESAYYSELGYAKEVADHLRSEHFELVLTPEAFFESLPQLVWHQDEPLRSAPTVALYHIAKLAGEHVKVVLTGEGSDELFAGYDRYWATGFNLRWGRLYEQLVPRVIRQRCVRDTLGRWPVSTALKRKLSHTFLARSQRPEELLFDNWYAIFPQAIHSCLFSEEVYSSVRDVNPYETSAAMYKGRASGRALDDMLYLDQKSYLVALLTKQDTMSMAASIESRVPFLDHKVVEFAAQVPMHQKLCGQSGKWLVKQAFRKFLPASILNRKKTGFPVPWTDWLQRGYASSAGNILTSERARSRGLFNPSYVDRLLEECRAGVRDHAEPIWSLLNMELWARVFLDGDSPAEMGELMGESCMGLPPSSGENVMLEVSFWFIVAVLAYIYAGYPLLMASFSGLSRRNPREQSYEPTVTIIIPAYNEAEVITQKLQNALALEYPVDKLEILVGSDCSSDSTVDLAQTFADRGVKVFPFTSRRGKASVVNDLVQQSGGDVLLMCDANVMFAQDALRRLTNRLADERIGAVTGDVRLKSEDCSFGVGEKLYYALERGVQLGESQLGSLMGVDGGMYVLRKDLFVPLPADTILDDFVISMRVIQNGSRVVYEPAAIATENATPSALSEFRRRMRVSAGAAQSVFRGEFPPPRRPIELWQYLSHKFLRWCIPFLLVATFVLSACLLKQGIAYQLIFGIQLLGYLLAIAGAVSVPIRQTRIVGIPFYFTMTFVAMVAGLGKALLFRQSGAWTKTERTASVS